MMFSVSGYGGRSITFSEVDVEAGLHCGNGVLYKRNMQGYIDKP